MYIITLNISIGFSVVNSTTAALQEGGKLVFSCTVNLPFSFSVKCEMTFFFGFVKRDLGNRREA